MTLIYRYLILLVAIGAPKLLLGQAAINFTGATVVVGAEAAVKLEVPAGTSRGGELHRHTPKVNSSSRSAVRRGNEGWFELLIRNNSSADQITIHVDNPLLSVCNLYRVNSGRPVLLHNAGASRPFYYRDNAAPSFAFDVRIIPGDTDTFRLFASSEELFFAPIVVSSQAHFLETQTRRDIASGIYIGIILVMAVYNLFVAISTRDNTYAVYVLFILAIGLEMTVLTGYAYKYLFPDFPVLNSRMILGSVALAGVSGVFFVRSFLRTRVHLPKLDRFLLFVAILYAIVLLLTLLGAAALSSRLANIAGLLGAVGTYVAGITLYRRGSRPALFFIIAWSAFLLGLFVFVLRNVGILPYNTFTSYTMQAGSAIEVALLSIALADRINILKKENDRVQLAALATAEENARLVSAQNLRLEAEVDARTKDLSDVNQGLTNTLAELKAAQSQLVEQEKMATLGQLTAGVAHEINNPINFVTANINPLRRDLDQIFEVVDVLSQTATSDNTTDARRNSVRTIFEDADYDYLKEEITTLLAGVHEGSSRTADIVKGLKLFSRLDENDLKFSDINQGMDATLIIVNTLLANRINLTKNYAHVPPVECYAGQLNQVWLNILTNAIHAIKMRFGDAAGGEICVTTALQNESVLISIGDNGYGMDEATQEKIFEPFFTTKEVGEGTGLGLSIVFNTIKKHSGQIRVESAVGNGTTFHISLPLSQPL